MFCNNLTAQQSDPFKEEVASMSGVNWFGLKNATDLWQQVDAGYAQMLKVLTKQAHHNWLDSDDNADRWYGNTTPYDAKERRILLTHWCGDAYNKLIGPEYDAFRWKIWQKTGGLLTADGSDDHLIAPEGLPNYTVPPPMDMIEPTNALPLSNKAPPANEEDPSNALEEEEASEP